MNQSSMTHLRDATRMRFRPGVGVYCKHGGYRGSLILRLASATTQYGPASPQQFIFGHIIQAGSGDGTWLVQWTMPPVADLVQESELVPIVG